MNKTLSIALLFFMTLTVLTIADGYDIVDAARSQIGKTLSYDPRYVALDYPAGDIPIESGVCTDVIIRALRKSRNIDLQKLVHEDMEAHFEKYPQIWGLKRADKNIDHRRAPNLQTYFKRSNFNLPTPRNHLTYQPGDIITCTIPHTYLTS
ncbi:MAG: DUF1287 domain-containing protein [Verrucomicrobiota bacterium]